MDNKEYLNLINNSKFFNRVIKQTEEKTLPRLNIGCGPNVFPYAGWINYDREDIKGYLSYISTTDRFLEMPPQQKKLADYLRGNGCVIDFRVHDLKNGFAQHADFSIESIYLGQMIEHLSPIHEVPAFLKECYRMLKSKGVLRITTPDLDLLIDAYKNGQMDKFSKEQPAFYKEADPSAQLAYIMYGSCGPACTWNNYEGHMFLFTKASMTAALKKAGFIDITFYYESGKGSDSVMTEQVVDEGMSHSFIVEAVK